MEGACSITSAPLGELEGDGNSTITMLAIELQQHIWSFLTPIDLFRLSLVCRLWCDVTRSEESTQPWKTVALSYFGGKKPDDMTWRFYLRFLYADWLTLDKAATLGSRTILLVWACKGDHHRVVKEYLQSFTGKDRSHLLNRLISHMADAAREGFIETVKTLIGEGVPIVSTLEPATTGGVAAAASDYYRYCAPLIEAAAAGRIDILHLLLARPEVASLIDAGQHYKTGPAALWRAMSARKYEAVSLLISKGADVNLRPEFYSPPIYLAAESRDLQMVRLLGSAGARLDAVSKDGATPLCLASANGDTELVSYLLDHGANVNASSRKGSTPLLLASYYGWTAVVSLLLQAGARIDAANYSGATSLFLACQEGHLSVVRLLLEGGADVTACRASDKATPLVIAAQKGFLEIVALLFESGAVAKVPQHQLPSANPLRVAVNQGNLEVVWYLVDKGYQTDIRDVILAAKNSHSAVVRYLVVEAGVAVDDATWSNAEKTALYYSFKKKADEETLRALLEAGARLDICTNRTCKTLCYLAAKKRYLAGLKLLLHHAKEVRKFRLDVDVADRRGRTALWYAAKLGDLRVAKLLVRHGAKISQKDKKGRTCIDIASQREHTHLVSLLVNKAYSSVKLYA